MTTVLFRDSGADQAGGCDFRGEMRGAVVLFRGNDGGVCFVLWRMTGRLFGFVADDGWGLDSREQPGTHLTKDRRIAIFDTITG